MRAFLIAAAVTALAAFCLAEGPRPIAGKYVLAVVAAHFQHPVDAADVDYMAPLTSASGDPGLVITSARADQRRGGVDLECRAAHDPRLPAFTIWVRDAVLPKSAQPAPGAPVLVSPGELALLTIERGTLSLVTQVRPLQPARLGQRVRALSLATHAVIEVEPIAPNEVRLADR